METTVQQMYMQPLRQSNCSIRTHHPYGKAGVCFSSNKGDQHFDYWMYSYEDMFTVSVSDMLFSEDFTNTFMIPEEFISVFYYDSVGGIELPSGKPIKSCALSAFISDGSQYTATYRGGVPVRGVSINITPAYYDAFLMERLPGGFARVKKAFAQINSSETFPELLLVMRQIQNCRLAGVGAQLYYESKVNEAIALIVANAEKERVPKVFMQSDKEQLAMVQRYLLEHISGDVTLPELARLACMSVSKLKYAFKSAYGCNISEYIGNLRINYAQDLLQAGNETISEISRLLGYKTTSAFTKMFKEKLGILPKDYRKSAAGPQ